ncbi:tyrosine-type recombinase/integrase [Microbispora sp. NEAU-D428]|uniref:tyrosine-type recombinase/integrase n=1 Tax=Microbispora sitophila TaxID=2771537 RepID=UPI001867BE93|nr:tyrosine-type recombinase/integrase [Microbispora sitophila]MBE3014917.1 tyrosine-type recombinase/integrase [Microbispora sitophila]
MAKRQRAGDGGSSPASRVPAPGDLPRALVARLVFTTRQRTVIVRNEFNRFAWKTALEKAGLPTTRENGFHMLRHHFALVLLEDGVSIKAVTEFLGHADPGFTLRTYTHLMPSSEDRMRAAIESAWAEGRQTAQVPSMCPELPCPGRTSG